MTSLLDQYKTMLEELNALRSCWKDVEMYETELGEAKGFALACQNILNPIYHSSMKEALYLEAWAVVDAAKQEGVL